MVFDVTILGSSSATPTIQRHPTSQVLNYKERLYLIDCGEGTQMQLLRYRIKFNRINHIFISHLHGDHYFGLMGLISTMHLQGRTAPLHVYGPVALNEIIYIQLKVSETELRFPLEFHPVDPLEKAIVLEEEDFFVESIPLFHRVPTTGYLFKEKQKDRKLLKDRLEDYNIHHLNFEVLKKGGDIQDEEGNEIKNEWVTTDPEPERSYAYCSDTVYNELYHEQIRNVDLLYHEATFMHDMLERASETMHTTALQAGEIAKVTKAKSLLIGHFSARYRDLDPLLQEAKTVFTETHLAIEGHKFTV